MFTHAGITYAYWCLFHDKLKTAYMINQHFLHESNIDKIAMIGRSRGGMDRCGSFVWADLYEHYGQKCYNDNIYQIFGHTYCKEPIITSSFAMLDDGKHCFVLDENGINKWNTII